MQEEPSTVRISPTEERVDKMDIDAIIASATKSFYDRVRTSGYEEMSDTTSKLLREWQSQLHIFLQSSNIIDEPQRYRICNILAWTCQELGDYEDSRNIYQSLCSLSSSQLHDRSFTRERHKMDTFIHGLQFLIDTEREIDNAEEILRTLPWISADIPGAVLLKQELLFNLIRVLNLQHNYKEASRYLLLLQKLYPSHELKSGAIDAEMAMARSGEGSSSDAYHHLVRSFIRSSVGNGPWHRQTLGVLFRFGKFLKAWNRDDAASRILTECCKGLYYRFGTHHPVSVRAYRELESCTNFRSCPDILRHLGNPDSSRIKKQSIAYEHIHLRTGIDVIRLVEPVDFKLLLEELNSLLPSSSRHEDFALHRMIAQCMHQTGDSELALLRTVALRSSIGDHHHESILELDTAIYHRGNDNTIAQEMMSRKVLRRFEDTKHQQKDQAKAIHRRLTKFGLTHFTRPDLVPWILSPNTQPLGRGSQAQVDAVTIGSASYARKSIFLNPVKQHSIRKAIRNEVSNTRMLDHPHVVRIYLTFEERRLFHIVMRPLADCDLEVFLAQKTYDNGKRVRLGWKWIGCLANTLAFIHSKDIRHKDIKPRNILVANEKIVFADFGSSHAFIDEASSSTEGPAYGHTVMYCAPEVISEGKRNRSADVFSLGCVITEMVLWIFGGNVPKFHERRRRQYHGSTTIAYHASLDIVEQIFLSTDFLAPAYNAFIKPMIEKEPAKRPTASEASKAISEYLRLQELNFECRKCRLELLVEDDGDTVDRS